MADYENTNEPNGPNTWQAQMIDLLYNSNPSPSDAEFTKLAQGMIILARNPLLESSDISEYAVIRLLSDEAWKGGIAEFMGVSPSELSGWWDGSNPPTLYDMGKLRFIFGLILALDRELCGDEAL